MSILCSLPFFLFDYAIVSFIRNWLSAGGKQQQHKGTTIISSNSILPSLGELLQEAESLREFVSIIQLVNYTDCGWSVLPNCSRREMSADWELFRKRKCRPWIYTFITMVSFVSKPGRVNNQLVSIIMTAYFATILVIILRKQRGEFSYIWGKATA